MATPRKTTMVRPLLTLVLGTALSFAPALQAKPLSQAQIDRIVNDNLGAKAKAAGEIGSTLPRYMWARLTGPSESILLIPVFIDSMKGRLNVRGVKAIHLPGQSGSADENIGANCMGLAFFHGMAPHATQSKPSSVHTLYECFSGYSHVAKGAPILRPLSPRAAGEAVLLDLESGGQLLVYWTGKGYSTTLVRIGD